MTDTGEITILEEESVKITNLRVIIGTKTYAMANVASVSMGKNDSKGILPLIVVAGILSALIGFIDLKENMQCLTLGVLMVIGGVLGIATSKTKYSVRIGSASGESNILESHDKATIKRVVNAMNEAIVRRG